MYEYNCIIRSITDGDGLRVDIDLGFGVVLRGSSGRGVNIRLYGIDAPESRTRNKQEKAQSKLCGRLRTPVLHSKRTLSHTGMEFRNN